MARYSRAITNQHKTKGNIMNLSFYYNEDDLALYAMFSFGYNRTCGSWIVSGYFMQPNKEVARILEDKDGKIENRQHRTINQAIDFMLSTAENLRFLGSAVLQFSSEGKTAIVFDYPRNGTERGKRQQSIAHFIENGKFYY